MSEVVSLTRETQDYAQKYRKRLIIDSGIINSPERGKVGFAVLHLEEYLRNSD